MFKPMVHWSFDHRFKGPTIRHFHILNPQVLPPSIFQVFEPWLYISIDVFFRKTKEIYSALFHVTAQDFNYWH